jgi:hypothetical protein
MPCAESRSGMRTIYNPHVKSIAEATRANLDATVGSWVMQSGVELTVDDPTLATQKQIAIHLADPNQMQM